MTCEGDDDTAYSAGTGLDLVGTQFSADTTYLQRRVGTSCSPGNSIRAIAADGTVTCEADDGASYTAGAGLSLVGSEFSVDFAGSGSADTASHSDHDHLGQTWTGTDNPLIIEGSFEGWPENAPLVLSNSAGFGAGLRVDSAGPHGVLVSADGNGVRVESSSIGVLVYRADWMGLAVERVGAPDDYWYQGEKCGVLVGGAEEYGLYVGWAGWDGLYVHEAVRDGVYIDQAGRNGVYVRAAANDGVDAGSTSAAHYGGNFRNGAPGGAGLYARSGSNTAADIVLGANDSTSDDGRLHSELARTSSDIIVVSNDAIQLELDNDDDETGNLWLLNGDDVTVFSVNESGDLWALGTKGAAVAIEGDALRNMYAVESSEVWFEDFGAGQLADGQATVPIEPLFARTVNLTQAYHVYLTPLGDCPVYVAEKTSQSFTVKAMGGQRCSIGFDYRVIARRLGYEDVRMEVVAVNAERERDR